MNHFPDQCLIRVCIRLALLGIGLSLFVACSPDPEPEKTTPLAEVTDRTNSDSLPEYFGIDPDLLRKARPATGFDYPVGPPDAERYYKFRGMIPGTHYGEDWNGTGGGNSDFGDLIYVCADGVVFYSDNFRPGWGTVVRVIHNIGTKEKPVYIESLYAHLASSWVEKGNKLRRGDPLGTIGSAGGIYHAHLHFEMRQKPNMPIPWDEGADTSKYIDPEDFIKSNRPD